MQIRVIQIVKMNNLVLRPSVKFCKSLSETTKNQTKQALTEGNDRKKAA